MLKGDTLSSIAARCVMSEADLLNANPAIQGSNDLQVGSSLRVEPMDGAGRTVAAMVGSFSRRAGSAIADLAGEVGSSVGDLLDKNPDLKARVDKLGHQGGLSGRGEAPAATVLPQGGASGSTVIISATGLAGNSPVTIGAGAPGTAYAVVAHAHSTAGGAMTAKVQVPQDSLTGQVLIFSVTTGPGPAVRTGRFVVSP